MVIKSPLKELGPRLFDFSSGEIAALHAHGPRSIPRELGGLVLDEFLGRCEAVRLLALAELLADIDVLDVDILIGARAHADFGEAGRVDANDVGGQDAGLGAALDADVEADDGVARLDAADAAHLSGGCWECRGRRRRRGIRRAAAIGCLGRGAGVHTGPQGWLHLRRPG